MRRRNDQSLIFSTIKNLQDHGEIMETETTIKMERIHSDIKRLQESQADVAAQILSHMHELQVEDTSQKETGHSQKLKIHEDETSAARDCGEALGDIQLGPRLRDVCLQAVAYSRQRLVLDEGETG